MMGYGEHRELRTLVQSYAAYRFELRPVVLGDERQPAITLLSLMEATLARIRSGCLRTSPLPPP
jgi:hypothetical protein